MGPANFAAARSRRVAEKLRSGALGQQALRVGDELLGPAADHVGLLAQVTAHRAHLALQPPPVLLDRALDQAPPLAQLPLEAGARAAHLALEAVARGDAAPLVALDLTLE